MRVILVEDEAKARRKLEDLLIQADPDIEVVGRLESVKETLEWLNANADPDLAFFDIQLADDISFEIFNAYSVNFPVIFVTAYDNYLMEAFEHNSLHYLLKPINKLKLAQALDKLRRLEKHFVYSRLRDLQLTGQTYKERIIVRKGMDNTAIATDDIAYVFTEHKISFIRDFEGNTYIVDQSLAELEKGFDPRHFFRANRQYIVSIKAIDKFKSIEHSKVLLNLIPESGEEVTVAKDNAADFRKWIAG